MSTLVHSVRRRTLVVGLVVASFAGASGSAFAASAASPYGYAMQYMPKAQVQKVAQSPYGYAMQYTPKAQVQKVPESLYGYAMQYTPKAQVQKVPESLYGYAMQYTPKAQVQKVPESLYGYAMQYTPKAQVQKIHQRPKVVVERTVVRCDVPVGTAHADDLWRCE